MLKDIEKSIKKVEKMLDVKLTWIQKQRIIAQLILNKKITIVKHDNNERFQGKRASMCILDDWKGWN
ncbi:MAG: hypothetical protein ACRDD7_17160 [Peptostreptococcaceae bacterium]